MRSKETVRRAITRWVEAEMEKQGIDGWYKVKRTWPQCPLSNPQCPDDLCVLPAGHTGTEEGYHVLGTTAYSVAEKFPSDWMMPEHTPVQVLVQEGWRRQRVMFPADR